MGIVLARCFQLTPLWGACTATAVPKRRRLRSICHLAQSDMLLNKLSAQQTVESGPK